MRWKCVPGVEKGWPRALETFHYTSPTEYNCTLPKIPPSPLQFPTQFNLPSSTSPPAAPPGSSLCLQQLQETGHKTGGERQILQAHLPGLLPGTAVSTDRSRSKQLTPRNKPLGKGTRPVLGREKSLISFPCMILDKTVPRFLLFVFA